MVKPTDASLIDTLLLEAAAENGGQRVLLYGVGPALAAALARRQCTATDTSLIRLSDVGKAAPATTLHREPALAAEQYASFNTAVIAAPQSRTLARRWLVEAHAALRDGGMLYLGGLNDGGIRPLIDDMTALFGNASTLLSKRRSRVASARKQGQAGAEWMHDPGIAPGSWLEYNAALPGGNRVLANLPGVFSADRLDSGTALLLDNLGDATGARVLDLGCGNGVIGLELAQRGAKSIDMLDENLYAVAAAQRNIALAGLVNARAEAADVHTPLFAGPYDLVVSNPPFHQGKDISYSAAEGFIRTAQRLLAATGRLVLVANSFLRYDHQLRERFAQVEALAATPGFTVWQAREPRRDP